MKTEKVVKEAKLRLGKEASKVKTDVESRDAELARKAAEEASVKALPFKEAKVIAEKNVVDYLLRAREAAGAVTALKNQSVKAANDAVVYQAKGLTIIAQQKLIEAHDLMNKVLVF